MNKSSDRPSGLGRGRGRTKHQEVPPKAAVGKQSRPAVEKQQPPPPSEMEQEQDIEDADAGCDCLVAQIMKDPSISGDSAQVSATYWPIFGRKIVHTCVHTCVVYVF